MLITKIYEFENAHIVRDCSSKRCRQSIHGHSYKCELALKSSYLDNAGMIYDYGLLKLGARQIIDSFDHTTTIWASDDDSYKNAIKSHSRRWIEMAFNPSAEHFSRVIFVLVDRLLKQTEMKNGEMGVELYSVKIMETASSSAICFREDAYSKNMGEIKLDELIFSEGIIEEWDDERFFQKLKNGEKFINPEVC